MRGKHDNIRRVQPNIYGCLCGEETSSIINYKVNEVKQTTKETRLGQQTTETSHNLNETTLLVCYWLTGGKPTVCYQRRWVHPNLVAPGVLLCQSGNQKDLFLSKVYKK